MPQLPWSTWAWKDWTALPYELPQDWSFIWSIYISVWPEYLHTSSLGKQKFLCWSFEIRGNRQLRFSLRFYYVLSKINYRKSQSVSVLTVRLRQGPRQSNIDWVPKSWTTPELLLYPWPNPEPKAKKFTRPDVGHNSLVQVLLNFFFDQ